MIPPWTDVFTPAAQPAQGWPSRPWDHRILESAAGHHHRVAVHADGRPVIDADGDEVFTGPGVDYQPVKVTKDLEPFNYETFHPGDLLSPRLQEVITNARRLSDFHGHTWVGEEHLALAILEREREVAEALSPLVDGDGLEATMAQFYEGPWATARLALVADRRASGWSRTPLRGEAVRRSVTRPARR